MSSKNKRAKGISQISIFVCLLLGVFLPPGSKDAAEENRSNRLSIGLIQLVSPRVRRQFGWPCASWAMQKERTSSRGVIREGILE